MAEAQAGSRRVTLFKQKAPGGLTYRIPALLYLPHESVFLAFAEKRSTPRDEHAKHLVMRRGQKEGKSVQWGPEEPLMTAILPDHRTMNPCPVYEKRSGRIFLFFICVQKHVTEWTQIKTGRNAARLCYVSSQNGGRTWSQLADLTDEVIGDDLRDWATFAVGPGHGLQLSSGRLVIPAYAYYIHRSCFSTSAGTCTKPHFFMFYSDDHGQHWTRGQLVKSFRTVECQVAEVTSPHHAPVLYCNARSPDKYRVEAFSMDGGGHFEKPFLSETLPETGAGCQGSVVSFNPMLKPGRGEDPAAGSHFPGGRHPTAAKTTESWMIFSHPTSRHSRIDLGVYLNTSPLVKNSWKAPRVIFEGPCGYSDLAVCEDGHSVLFGCLFECGVSNGYEEIAFQLFADKDLLGNISEEG
ncbi:sialidase-3-like [Sphaerodactylus townsendi]|uniref:Uncharacterized protein n=1 Tax=Sphaerodactylus townsendi TaxID=933632 RepID=A0ACB8FFA7_9SAUR|nr:sialidase-3-like [Sphaerodactylus townsendi]